MAQNYNIEALKRNQQCQTIKKQLNIFMKIELGLEVYGQVTLQILVLLLARTESATTGGLETVFNQEVLRLGKPSKKKFDICQTSRGGGI